MSVTLADGDEIAGLVTACADGFQRSLSEPGAADAFAAKIVRRADVIARRDTAGKLVGCVAVYCNDLAALTAFVTLVAVHPACRGRGLARAMLDECLALAHRRGFLRVNLRVLRRNEGAIVLYRAIGFDICGHGDDDFEMSLDLSSAPLR